MNIIVDCLLLVYSAVVRFVMIIASFCRFKSSRKSVHLNALSEECLLLIFDRIALAELMRIDQVCARWAMLLPSATARRRTLALIVGGFRLDTIRIEIPYNDYFEITFYDGYYRPYYTLPERESALTLPSLVPKSFDEFLLSNLNLKGFFDILYHHTSIGGPTEADLTEMARFKHACLTGQLATYFASLFPNVKTLLVINPECFEAELQSVVELLDSWPLVSVKLWLHTVGIDKKYENLPEKHPIGNLLRSINNQKALQELTLDIEGVGNGQLNFTFPVESYSFIGRLKVAKLYLGFYDTDNTIWQTVHRLDSPKLEHIGLGNRADFLLNSALNEEFAYTHKVRQLYSLRSFRTVQQLGEMCSRFNSLTMLKLYWHSNLTFTELVANLASLPHLTYLQLYILFERHPQNLFALVDIQVADGDQPPQPNSLPQVKVLKFLIKKRTHWDFESFSSHVFPSVETIIVENVRSSPPVAECTICRVNNINFLEMAKLCDRMLIRSLKSKFAPNSPIRIYPTHVPHFLSKVLTNVVLLVATVVVLFTIYKVSCLAIYGINLLAGYLSFLIFEIYVLTF